MFQQFFNESTNKKNPKIRKKLQAIKQNKYTVNKQKKQKDKFDTINQKRRKKTRV